MVVKRLMLLTLAVMVLIAPLSTAQVREFDFYSDFRQWWQSRRTTTSPEAGLEQYREKLRTEGIAASEIDRRVTLIQTRRQDLENDFWNRFFTIDKPAFNTEPNAFLVSVVADRKVGRALDVGMGEGRNALYLAKLGWDVTGIDPADKAVALAAQRAQTMGLKLRTIVASDHEFDFGREQWDLILFSWVPPTQPTARLIEALKPGGLMVVEHGEEWLPMNGLLKAFEPLRVLRYENQLASSDFFRRREMQVVRLLAEKPTR